MLTIRRENENDFSPLRQLIQTAFETADVKDGDEQDFVERLRKGANYVPELALVAEWDGKRVGHIMLTKTHVAMKDGRFEELLLASVSVLLEHRNQGVGSKLITESMRRAAEMGYKAVFLAGDRNYYARFGFVPARRYGIRCPQELPEELIDNIMACELLAGSLSDVSGTLIWQDAHDLDVEAVQEGLARKKK